MTMTDPLADMLTRIRNANLSMHEEVAMPSSKQKRALAEVLHREGYISDYHETANTDRPGSTLTVAMKYSSERERVISGLKRISKPGLRIYCNRASIPRVLGGIGLAVISTSKGLMSDREARRNRVGGEIICHVW